MNPLGPRARRILLHPHWVTAALFAAIFFQFALNRGGVESAIWTAGAFLVVHAVNGSFDLRQLPRPTWIFLAAVGGLLMISWSLAPESTDPGRAGRILKFAVIVVSVQYLASQQLGEQLRAWVTALAVAIVVWQSASRGLTGSLYGTFANPHYLAYFSALLLPVLVMAGTWFRPPYGYLVYVFLALDLTLVFNDLKKPTIPLLAIGAGLGVLVWSVASRRMRWTLAALVIGLAAAATLLIDDAQFARLGLATPSGDERVQIWADSLRMLRDNDLRDWLVGNGIGSFRNDFRSYFTPQFSNMPLPHNHFLELLYENGVVVTTVIVGFLAYLAWRSLRMGDSLADRDLRNLARANLSAMAIWFVFSFLAFGVYSRYTLYPFGIMVGLFFHLTQQAERAATGPGIAAETGR
jgi:O-Antigen ligase